MSIPRLSLVIPLHNEEAAIDALLERSVRSVGEITTDYEIICVDDGSIDRSLDKLLEHHRREPRIRS